MCIKMIRNSPLGSLFPREPRNPTPSIWVLHLPCIILCYCVTVLLPYIIHVTVAQLSAHGMPTNFYSSSHYAMWGKTACFPCQSCRHAVGLLCSPQLLCSLLVQAEMPFAAAPAKTEAHVSTAVLFVPKVSASKIRPSRQLN